jgi:hypothetical protein
MSEVSQLTMVVLWRVGFVAGRGRQSPKKVSDFGMFHVAYDFDMFEPLFFTSANRHTTCYNNYACLS